MPPEEWRPTLGGDYAYELSAAAFAGERVVVHYVPTGSDRPLWGDRNGNGVPDFVETVAATGDRALEQFEQLGFKAPAPDTGGPDARPSRTSAATGSPGARSPTGSGTGASR